MIAILLFSGKSTRFWPLKEKSLFPIWGTNLLELQIRKLKGAGFKEIILVGGSHNLKEAKKLFPTQTFVKQSGAEPGMRGGLLAALPKCKRRSVMIVSANDVIDESAFTMLRTQGKERDEGGLILARKVNTYFPGGYLRKTGGRRILSIIEKPERDREPSKFVNIVAHVHADASVLLRALKAVPKASDDAYERALGVLFKQSVYDMVLYTGHWQAVKYPWHLLDLLPSILPPQDTPVIHPTASVHPSAVIEGGVVIGQNVKVLAHATVMGPCFIGEGTIVANNALVRGSSVGKNCVIGYNTEIARSILADNVWAHSSYVGDSVVGPDVSMGAGTLTGNLRLDETEIASMVNGKAVGAGRIKLGAIIGSGCRTGIHTCFSPGVKVGPRSFIHSCELVKTDVPDGSYVKDGTLRPNKHTPITLANRNVYRKQIAPRKGSE